MHSVLLLICSLLLTISPPGQPDGAGERTRAVAKALDDWHDAAAKADEKRYFGHFAPGAVFMGTDATERWTVDEFRAYAKPHFDKGKAWSFTAHDRHVMFAADAKTAWFDEQLETPNLGPSRGSGVLTLIGGDWKIAHYNLTIPIPNDLCDNVVAQIAAHHKKAKAIVAGADGAAVADGMVLNLLTFNIRYNNPGDGKDAWPNRRAMVAGLIRAGGAGGYDVIGLQEALHGQLQDLLTDLPGYASIGVGRDDGKEKGEYAAILYLRASFDVAESGTFWLSETPEVPGSTSWGNTIPRICTWARLTETEATNAKRTAPGAPPRARASFYVFNVHLDHQSQLSRERSVMRVQERINMRATAAPVVWMGDFNAGEGNAAIAMINRNFLAEAKAKDSTIDIVYRQSPLTFVDSFRVLHPGETAVGTFHAFKGGTDGDKIDYIFVPKETRVLEAAIHRSHVGDRYPSDHFPVSAKIALPGGSK